MKDVVSILTPLEEGLLLLPFEALLDFRDGLEGNQAYSNYVTTIRKVIKNRYGEYYATKRWKTIREEVIKRDEKCVRCAFEKIRTDFAQNL